MSIFSLLEANASRFADRPAVTAGTFSLTYNAFIKRVRGLAGGLRQAGVGSGDRVLLCMENCAAYLEVLFSCWAAGACSVPINAKLHRREIAAIAADARARMLFCTPKLYDALTGPGEAVLVDRVVPVDTAEYEALTRSPPLPPVEVAPDQPAWIFYTSGTTGRSKGAVLTHRNLLFMAMAYYADVEHVGAGDQMLHVSPLSHGTGLYALPQMLRGSEQIVVDGFDADEIIDIVDRSTRISTFLVPTTLNRLVRSSRIDRLRTRNLGSICYGGAPMYQSDLDDAVRLFPNRLYQLYGQGESPMTITGLSQALHSDPSARSTCGPPRTGVRVRIVDDGGADLPTGEVGEVATASDCVMTGYWNNPTASHDALVQGWLRTGDMGCTDERGFLTLKDRSKDLIISGGSNIYPREVEEVLLTHASVEEASVIGMPHPEWGEEVVAFIVPRLNTRINQTELDNLCLSKIARFKRPKKYVVVDRLPKSDYGKILKKTLRDWAV